MNPDETDPDDLNPARPLNRGFLVGAKRLTGIVVDVETGGLDERHHALLEIGAIFVVEGSARRSFSLRVQPEPSLVVDPEAAAVNGYTADSWSGLPEAQVLGAFAAWVQLVNATEGTPDRADWIGHNCDFDRRFLRAAYERNPEVQTALSGFTHRDIDLHTLSLIPFLMGDVRSRKLDDLCTALLGRHQRTPHYALGDAHDAYACLTTILDRTLWARGEPRA